LPPIDDLFEWKPIKQKSQAAIRHKDGSRFGGFD
jgi:hypothetical protein